MHEVCKATQWLYSCPKKTTTHGYCYTALAPQVTRSDISQSILNKHLFTDSMLPYYTKHYALPLLNWEISLTFAWTELIYLVIFMIKMHQTHFWSASLNIDFDPPICVDLENLAETFLGKLLSGETNFYQIEN